MYDKNAKFIEEHKFLAYILDIKILFVLIAEEALPQELLEYKSKFSIGEYEFNDL